jgi:hypothetical protein
MHQEKSNSCPDRIVSLRQPYVRPMVTGKQQPKTEFGSKLNVLLTENGIAHANVIRWNNYHEGKDLIEQVEYHKERYGYYPKSVLADAKYGTRENRQALKKRGIRFAGKPLGRPSMDPETQKNQCQQRRQDNNERIPIEGKFGQGKGAYGLNYIRAKTQTTSEAWIRGIFLSMNLIKVLKGSIFVFNFLRQYGQRQLRKNSKVFFKVMAVLKLVYQFAFV